MGRIFPDPGGHATSKKSRYGLRIAKFCDDDGRLLVNDPRRGTGRCRKIDHGIDLRENTPFTFYRIRGRTGADLGDRYTVIEHIFAWLTDLHNNLLGGNTGRLVNGI